MKAILKSLLLLCALFVATNVGAINENYINKVGNWSNQGNNYNAGGITLRERYWGAHHDSNVTVMDQTISGLPEGYYTVELYANASLANIGAADGGGNGALNRVFIFANDTELTIPIIHQRSVAKPTLWVIDVKVSSAETLTLGIKAKENGANWYLIGVKSIKYRGATAVAKTTDSGSWWSAQYGNSTGNYTSHQGVMHENWQGSHSTGKKISQTVTNLPEGYYHVGIYASASQAWIGSAVSDGTQDCTFAYVLTNGEYDLQSISVPVYNQTGVTVPGMYDFYNVHVGSDGKMEIGLRNDKEGANWHLLSVKDIHYLGTNPDYSHLIGENQSDWQGANGMVGWASCIKMVENYQTSQVVGSALMTRKITDLPVGLYTLKLYCNANRANGVGEPLPSEGVENTALVVTGAGEPMTQMVKVYSTSSYTSVADMQLFTFEDIEVDDAGTIDIALGNAVAGANWFTIAGESLVWTGISLKLLKTSLQNAVDAASLRVDEFMSTATKTALTTAISAAQTVLDDEDATEEQLNMALANLQSSVAAIETWQSDWATAKAPLIAALERFEADYNDGANGALRPMSDEAWATLVTAAGAAATAKDQYEDLSQLATAATTFNAAMDAAELSITLYNKYVLLKSALNRYNSTQFPLTDYDTSTDAKVKEAIAAMNTAWENYKATLDGNQDVTAMAGSNMGFETAQGDNLNGNAYMQPEWNVTYVYAGVDGNKQYETMTTETDDLPDVAIGNALHMRNRWAGASGKMQITKVMVLPAGEYGLSAWMKVLNSTDGHLCYYEVDGHRTDFIPSSLGEWVKMTNDIAIESPAIVTISFGVSGGNDMDVYVDDVTLTLYNQTAYERAYDTAKTMKDEGATSLALTAALSQYAESTEAGATTAGYDIEEATRVLQNAITMAKASDNATSLLANPQFGDGTTGWTHNENIEGYNDVSIKTDGSLRQFNVWGDKIKYSDLYQQVQGLPNGTYELTANFQTYTAENRKTVGNGKRSADGFSWISLYADNFDETLGSSRIMRSTNIGHGEGLEDDARHDYSIYFTVVNNKANIGVRSDYTYYRVTDFRLQMVDADTHKADVAKAMIYDAVFKPEAANSTLEFDLSDTKYADASGVDLHTGGFVQQPNALIKASSTGQIAGNNVIIDGTCANLVLTDKAPFKTTSGFTATSATYTRTMSSQWGTVMLPYSVISDENVQYYTLKKVNADAEDGTMTFVEADELAANTPGVFVKKSEDAESVTLTGYGTVPASASANTLTGIDDASGWTLNGTFENTVFDDVKTDEDNDYYYISSDKFWHATGKLTVAPFRAYFTTAKASSNSVRAFRLVVDDADGIKLVPVTDGEQNIYTLSGVKVQQPLRPGIYIINNKKTVVK